MSTFTTFRLAALVACLYMLSQVAVMAFDPNAGVVGTGGRVGEASATFDDVMRHKLQINARNSVKALLRDPSRARFDNEFITPRGAVCGFVNAPNAFGGYAGRSPFVVTTDRVMVADGEAYRKHCA
jgi:hypothetical protein